MRSEEYGADSRIPEIKIGTPEQDALRRDLTLNSLFYNINTKQIEDFTNNGINDLKNGIARTPLEPTKTFIDDPLRVLRVIRFAQRYNFKIEPSMFDAARDHRVQDTFENKLTYERIMKEMDKMFENRDPHVSV